MRMLLSFVVAAVSALVVVFGLRWFDLISQDAAIIGFATGTAVAIVIALANRRKGSPG